MVGPVRILIFSMFNFFSDMQNKLHDTMQKELIAVKDESLQLKGTIDARDKRILLLEGQLKSKEQKYQNDLKLVQRNFAELKSELDAKSNTIGYLTAQLHQLKLRGINQAHNEPMIPAPPREGTPTGRSRLLRRSVTSPIARSMTPEDSLGLTSHQVDVSEIQNAAATKSKSYPARPHHQSISDPPRPALGHSAARRERELVINSRPKPTDYKELIAVQRNAQPPIFPKPPAEPLPPILASKIGRRHPGQARQSRDTKNSKNASRGGEITEMVVEPVSSPERTWRKAQDSKYK